MTTNVIVGQEMALTGVVTSPIAVDITSKQWTVPPDNQWNSPIANYVQTSDYGAVIPLDAQNLQSEAVTYYWIGSGTNLVVTYSVTICRPRFR